MVRTPRARSNREVIKACPTASAGRGQVYAQSILGIMYATGQGVARNIPEATKWLTIASEAGDRHAIRMLHMIEGLPRSQ